MNTRKYTATGLAFALVASVLPALARAEHGGVEASGQFIVNVVDGNDDANVSGGASTSGKADENVGEVSEASSSEGVEVEHERGERHEGRGRESSREEATTTEHEHQGDRDERLSDVIKDRLELIEKDADEEHGNDTSTEVRIRNLARFIAHADEMLDATATPAFTLEDLRARIEEREAETDHIIASTSPSAQSFLRHAAAMSIAAHAFLDFDHVLGADLGKVAADLNDSIGTTTSAEARIEGRGFFARFFFGGDAASADVIKEQVAANQRHIDALTNLLAQANVSADVKAELSAQLDAMQKEQARLSALANAQAKAWGLFSWRF